MSKNTSSWLSLYCYEKRVYNPSSLYGIAFAKCLSVSSTTGECLLERLQSIRYKLPSVPINVIYSPDCTSLYCWITSAYSAGIHKHIELSDNYKFFTTRTRSCRKCIAHAYQYDRETTVAKPVLKRKLNATRADSCKRRLFE
jgi:hypothetical protein